MIEVEAEQQKQDAPAQTIEELAERLYPLVGKVLRLEIDPVPRGYYESGVQGYTAVGSLDSLVLIDGANRISVYLGSSSSSTERSRKVVLSSSVFALMDGQWVTVHAPVRGER